MESPRTSSLSGSFWSLNVSQFLGALNDNFYRFVMALALVARASDPGTGEIQEAPLFVAGAVFAAPFILFSSAAGVLADRYSKRRLIVLAKFLEIVIMALGLAAFLGNWPIFIYTVLFLMAAQSTLFGPCKFGILPEMVPPERLSYVNGLMEMFAYLAIILGTVAAAAVYENMCDPGVAYASTLLCWKASSICIVIAVVGFLYSLGVKETGVKLPQKRESPFFWVAVVRNLRVCGDNRHLRLTLFAIGFFLFLGGYVQLNIIPYGVAELGMMKARAMYLFLALALGIGAGSYLAGKASGRCVEIGLVPVGSLLFSAMLILLAFSVRSRVFAVAVLFLMGVGGGFYIVPLQAYLQQDAPEKIRGELIATSYFLSFCGLAIAAGLLLFFEKVLGLMPATRFLILGLGTIVLTVYSVWTLPDFLIRFLGLIGTRLIYRLETIGAENMPLRGGALLVVNHVSYIDAAFLMATQQRRIRFVMYREYYKSRRWNWLYRLMGAIPISNTDPPKEILRSLNTARKAIEEGWLVCLFAEGELTRTGNVMEFKRGLERIVQGTNRPIIPVHLHGVWGSRFSYGDRETFERGFARLRRLRVTITFGLPMPSESTAFQVRRAVMELGSKAFELDHNRYRPLPLEFARTARANWGGFCMADTTGKELTFGRTLTGALALADVLRPEVKGQRCVGLLMPTSVGGALVNLAVSFLGKIPVNLNYTASKESVRSTIAQCGIERIITSSKFLEKFDFSDLPGLLPLEDLAGRVTGSGKVRSLFEARFSPLRRLIRRDAGDEYGGVDDTAVIIFSSGSTGDPKGIELSHANITSNVRGVRQVFRLRTGDVLCGVLPFFHSFGYTGGLWLPLLVGIGVAYHPNPMEARRVGELVKERRCTLIFSTPTFLLAYLKRVPPEDFASLRFVIVGAEKLKNRVAAAFQERFGILPLEGYGATELSPIASVNVPNVNLGGTAQEGYRLGSIGRPIPGVTMKVVDPGDFNRELPHGEDGLLLVKGPNVMKGYLGRPEQTAAVVHEGWYVTGDVARIDHDGFVTITDRLSRFSKIGGEMVPHLVVEEHLHAALSPESQVFAVTSLPDEKKGERLVVLYTSEAGDPREAHRRLKESGLPNLWIPSREDFLAVESIPLLGSGKIDLKGLKILAQKLVSG